MDKVTAINLVSKNGYMLKFASQYNDDIDVVKAAVRQNGWSLLFASPDLRDNNDVVLLAVLNDPTSVMYASDRFRMNKDFMLELIKRDYYCINLVHPSLKEDSSFMEEVKLIEDNMEKENNSHTLKR